MGNALGIVGEEGVRAGKSEKLVDSMVEEKGASGRLSNKGETQNHSTHREELVEEAETRRAYIEPPINPSCSSPSF